MSLLELRSKIEDKTARIAVVGLGYVGLPVAALFAKAGFDVLGIEIRQDRVDCINSGLSPIEGNEPGLSELIRSVVSSKAFRATPDFTLTRDRHIILINVETPVTEEHMPEYQALRSAVKSIGENLIKGALVIVESTIMPGTMEHIVLPLLEETSGMKCGQGFFLGNCPERVMPGKLIDNLQNMSRVVGGDSAVAASVMKDLYRHIVRADLDATDWITAELVKTVENSYRDVQIAFANEVAIICEALGADVWRVRDLVRKSPGREMLKPGAGVGGHCIPKDPWLLASSVRESHVNIRLIPAAREVNLLMPAHMLNLIRKSLGNLNEKKILLLGYAYLENSDDIRNSPAESLRILLSKEGAQVAIHDPFVREFFGDLYQMAMDCYAVVLVTAHTEYNQIDFKKLKGLLKQPLLIDGRHLWDSSQIQETGLELVTLGDASRSEGL